MSLHFHIITVQYNINSCFKRELIYPYMFRPILAVLGGSNVYLLEGTKTFTFQVMVILHYSKIFISQNVRCFP